MSYDAIPHNNYEAGFEAGYRSIMGTKATLPMTTPMEPMTEMDMTPFLTGVRKGAERARLDSETSP